MKWIDRAGYACAVGWSGQCCVTLYVGGIRSLKPIRIGNVVAVRARLIPTGRASMHVAVDVRASDPQGGGGAPTAHGPTASSSSWPWASSWAPVEVPAWGPARAEDRGQERYAQRLMELRKSIEDERREHRG